MGAIGDVVENRLLDHLVGGTSYQPSPPLYLALTTVAVTDTDTGSTITEADYPNYERVAVPDTYWAPAAGGEKHNSDPITFPECGSGEATVVGFALCTAATGGDIVMYGTVPSTVINATVSPQFAPGALSLTLD